MPDGLPEDIDSVSTSAVCCVCTNIRVGNVHVVVCAVPRVQSLFCYWLWLFIQNLTLSGGPFCLSVCQSNFSYRIALLMLVLSPDHYSYNTWSGNMLQEFLGKTEAIGHVTSAH